MIIYYSFYNCATYISAICKNINYNYQYHKKAHILALFDLCPEPF